MTSISIEAAKEKLKKAGWGLIPPTQYLKDMDPFFGDAWKKVQPFTMISPERGWALAEAIRYVCRANISGDLVECGVWKGGACLLASLILAEFSQEKERKIWLYDTFSGMSKPSNEDRIAHSGESLQERNPKGWWAISREEVKKTLSLSPLPLDRFHFVPGVVEETLEKESPESLAVLRLDTDWYSSTAKELEILYPKLSPGGVLIIDDYGHFTGARKAVDDYFKQRDEKILLHRSDYTGRVLIKPQ